MEQDQLERWQSLHAKICDGADLTVSERQEYDLACRQMDEEEMDQLQVMGLREEYSRLSILEKENQRLRSEKQRIDREIARLEAQLTDRSRTKIKAGV